MQAPGALRARVLTVLALLLTGGCAAAIGPAIDDARLALRVKTAIVNDPEVGPLPIEVDAAGGVVTLTGRVRSEADRQRAVSLARSVDGVRDVTATLVVADIPADDVPRPPPDPQDAARRPLRRLIGLGGSATATRPVPDGLADATAIGPMVRLPDRHGWGPTVGFSWTELEIDAGPEGGPGFARLRLRPIMLGMAYGRRVGPAAVSGSLVGGWSFNQVRPHRGGTGPLRAIAADNGFVWRPGMSIWYDVAPRVGVQVFAGGLFASPRVTFASDRELRTQRLRTNAAIVSVGVAYWVF